MTFALREIKKSQINKSKQRAILIVFFDIKDITTTEWIYRRQTINKHYYPQVLTTLRERIRRKQPDLWENDLCILYRENAQAYNNISLMQFLA